MSNPSILPPPPRRWPLFLVLGLVLAIFLGWSGLWFYVASQAKTEMVAWREHERQAGRRQDCATLSVGGYPFSIEVRCATGHFELGKAPIMRLDLPAVLARVQVYNPKLLTAEFTAPLSVSQQSGGTDYVLDWSNGRASVRGLPSQFEHGSLVLQALSVRDPSTFGSDPVFKAQLFELHGRPAPGSPDPDMAIATVLKLRGATAEHVHPIAAKPSNAEVTGVLYGMNDFSPMRWPERLKRWQARGGEVEITKARIEQDAIVVEGSGTLRLTAEGRLEGNLRVTVVGIDELLRMFNLERLLSEGQVGAALNALDRLIPGLGGIARQGAGPGIAAALGQRTELDGKPATALPLRFVAGTVFVGPFQVGAVPPLF